MSLLCVAAVTILAAQANAADPSACRVHNVTQGTEGLSFNQTVAAAGDGDLIRVRGVCFSTAIIDKDLAIEGVGDGPRLQANDRGRVIRVRAGAHARITGLVITGGRVTDPHGQGLGGGIENRGTLTLVDAVVRRNDAYDGAGILNAGSRVRLRPRRGRRSRGDPAAVHVALRVPRFRENTALVALPTPAAGRAHTALAAAPAADLLEVASGYSSFPILFEKNDPRVLRDVFDLPAFREVLAEVRPRKLRVVPVETAGVAVRAVAPVRLDRRLHVRGRHAARQAAGHHARARSRSAPRPARRRGTARAPRSAGARRARARAPTARPGPRGPHHADDLHDLSRPRSARPGRGTPTRRASSRRTSPMRWLDELATACTEVLMRRAPHLSAAEDRPASATALGDRAATRTPTAFTDPVPAPAR